MAEAAGIDAASPVAVCKCDDGYLSKNLSCIPFNPEDPCRLIDCSGHGRCSVETRSDAVTPEPVPVCLCEDGYHAEKLNCVENDTNDPCLNVECSGHGKCTVVTGPDGSAPQCACQQGYHAEKLSCVPDSSDPCANVTCSGNGSCVVLMGEAGALPACACNAGYHAEKLNCVQNDPSDACKNVTCSGHGYCTVTITEGGPAPTCICNPGYHADGLNCVLDQCGPANCTGCCDNNKCLEGTKEAACGSGGKTCKECGGTKQCVLTTCIEPTGLASDSEKWWLPPWVGESPHGGLYCGSEEAIRVKKIRDRVKYFYKWDLLWKNLNPERGVFCWEPDGDKCKGEETDYPEYWLKEGAKWNKKVIFGLGLLGGIYNKNEIDLDEIPPQWVIDDYDVQKIGKDGGGAYGFAVWQKAVFMEWQNFTAAFSAKYKDDPRLGFVYAKLIAGEFYLPAEVIEACQHHGGLTAEILADLARDYIDDWAAKLGANRIIWTGLASNETQFAFDFDGGYRDLGQKVDEYVLSKGGSVRSGGTEGLESSYASLSTIGVTRDTDGHLHATHGGVDLFSEEEEYHIPFHYWTLHNLYAAMMRFNHLMLNLGPLNAPIDCNEKCRDAKDPPDCKSYWCKDPPMCKPGHCENPPDGYGQQYADFVEWLRKTLGHRPSTSPDAWAVLRWGCGECEWEEPCGKDKYCGTDYCKIPVKNIEHYLLQKDNPNGGESRLVDKMAWIPKWMDTPCSGLQFQSGGCWGNDKETCKHTYAYEARATDRTNNQHHLYFGVDDGFLSGGPHWVRIYVDFNYDTQDSPFKFRVEYHDTTDLAKWKETPWLTGQPSGVGWRIGRFDIKDAVFASQEAKDFRIYNAGNKDLWVRMVRVVKMDGP
jgi:hypothetical protein